MGEVKDLTPRLVDRWARLYISIYAKSGGDEAKKWALRFLKGPHIKAMTDRVNELLKHGESK